VASAFGTRPDSWRVDANVALLLRRDLWVCAEPGPAGSVGSSSFHREMAQQQLVVPEVAEPDQRESTDLEVRCLLPLELGWVDSLLHGLALCKKRDREESYCVVI